MGKFGGALAKTPATELGSIVIREAIARAGLQADQIGEVIMGQVLAAGVGQNPARQAMMKAGVAQETPALTINAVCGSGLKSVMLAAQAIATGDSEIVVAGGQENMSLSPHVLNGSRDGQLVVVSRDLALAHHASGIASRLQQVLDDWNFLSPQLEDLYATLNSGKARHTFAFDPHQ